MPYDHTRREMRLFEAHYGLPDNPHTQKGTVMARSSLEAGAKLLEAGPVEFPYVIHSLVDPADQACHKDL